jgi:succinyl-diaminopimelate desuccinylase
MDKKIFTKQLEKLISFKTVTGDVGENSKALDYALKLVNKNAVIKRIKNGKAEVLLAGNSDTLNPDIAYMVHIDVVAGNPNQFVAKVKGDKLFGRGASDMKFSIPFGIEILNDLITKKSKLKFSLVITTDEETGGLEGGKFLAEKLKFKPKCLIVPDGGDNLKFVDKAKGVCQLVISSKGTPAHASRPWMGKNALDDMVKIGQELLKLYGKNSLKENWGTTMNIGLIQGGISVNQVCPEAVMKLDFRYPETDSIKNITNTVTKIAKKINPKITISQASTGLPTFTNISDKLVQKFINSMSTVYKEKIEITQTYGASDARHFAKLKIPVLMMKPIGGEIHSETEWVSISSSLKFYEGLKLFIDAMETKD